MPDSNRPSRLRFLRNWISLSGFLLATAAFFAFSLLFAVDLFSHHGNPYLGVLAYMIAPAFLCLGVGLVVWGFLLELRQEHRAKPGILAEMMVINLARPRDRKVLAGFACCSVGFLFLTALSSYHAYNYTESVQFCGQACHTSMEPEYVTSRVSPHSKVDCVACHVGPGAEAFIRTKLNGMRQLYHTVTNSVKRPVVLRDEDHPPAQQLCEQCHPNTKFTPPIDRTFRHFQADEQNTPYSVRLQLNMGGGDPANGPVTGIHWHMSPGTKIEFISPDENKATIPWFRLTDSQGKITEFRAPSFKDDPSKYRLRTMDCMDCHNRPAHQFKTPNDALDQALASGQLDPKVPNLKAKAVDVLVQPYETKPEALRKIADALKTAYPNRSDLPKIVSGVQAIYSANFFPEMKADWRIHPDQLGHKDAQGCFRCHDGLHKVVAAGTGVASQAKTEMKALECTSCHIILSQGNDEELTKLNGKGVDFVHIDSEYANLACAKCHTGAAAKE